MSKAISKSTLRLIAASGSAFVILVLAVMLSMHSPRRTTMDDAVALPLPPDGWAPRALAIADPNGLGRVRPLRPIVSSAAIGDGTYLLADYTNVYHFDPVSASVVVIQAYERGPNLNLNSIDRTQKYVPTGIAYDRSRAKVYVANYYANNLLQFSLEVDKARMILDRKIVDPNIIGSEAVVVSTDGRYLLSANYDGGTVTCYDLRQAGPSVEELPTVWKYPIGFPHGLAIDAGKVFVSSLSTGELHILSLDEGTLERKTGHKGWNPFAHEWMLPAAIAIADKGDVWIADAQTGFLTRLVGESLEVRAVYGGNGPGYHHFNMPYEISIDDGTMIVLSTYQQRILLFDTDPLALRSDWVLGEVGWQHLSGAGVSLDAIAGLRDYYPVGVAPLSTGIVPLLGGEFEPRYGALHALADSPIRVFTMPTTPSVFELFGAQYFMFSVAIADASVVFSPQDNAAFVVYSNGDLAALKVGFDCWPINGVLRCANKLHKQVELGRKALHRLNSQRTSSGLISAKLLVAGLPGARADMMHKAVRHWPSFRSEPGKAFALMYERCSAQPCTRDAVVDAARRYFDGVHVKGAAYLDEYLLVAMVSGVRPDGVGSK